MTKSFRPPSLIGGMNPTPWDVGRPPQRCEKHGGQAQRTSSADKSAFNDRLLFYHNSVMPTPKMKFHLCQNSFNSGGQVRIPTRLSFRHNSIIPSPRMRFHLCQNSSTQLTWWSVLGGGTKTLAAAIACSAYCR